MPESRLPFQHKQYEFTRYIRDPKHNIPPTGIEKRRIDMYRELVFNNVEDVLADNFPVLRKITEDNHWESMASDFLARHNSQSPYFLHIPEEFLNYLQNEREENEDDPPFLIELAHYEWAEMALMYSQQELPPYDENFQQDPLPYVTAVSDVAWVLSYRFPVHRISPEFLPQALSDQPTFLVVYRTGEDDIKFLELNPISYRLLQLIQQNLVNTAQQLLEMISEELQHPNPETVLAGGKDILCDLAKRRIIYRSK